MKKTNIVFSGFMAAILFSTGAMAVDSSQVKIASQAYVDRKDGEVLTTVQDTYATKETVSQIEQNVSSLDDALNNAETGLASKVEGAVETANQASADVEAIKGSVTELETTVGDDASGLVKDVTDLKSGVGGLESEIALKADAADLDAKEDVINKAESITAENQTSSTAYPSVGAIVEWTNQEITKLSDTGLPVNPDNILDNSISGSKLENGAVTTDKIADEAITEGKLSPELSAEISGKEDKSNKTDTIDGSSTSEQYPSASAVYTALGTKADASAIETINQNVTQVTEQVTQLGDVINNEETGLASQIEDAMLAAGGAQLTAEDAQKAAEAAQDTADSAVAGLAGKQDALGYTAENAANKTTKITSDNQSSPTAYPSVGAIVEWTNQEITKLSDTGLPVNPDNILDNSISGSKLENGAVTTDKIADGAVTTEKLGEDVVTTIDGKADASDVYTKTETNEKIVTLAVPQPDEDCKAESGLCVLSVGTDGQFKWVNVTEPAQ